MSSLQCMLYHLYIKSDREYVTMSKMEKIIEIHYILLVVALILVTGSHEPLLLFGHLFYFINPGFHCATL